jgi:anti-anti-sigma factor
MQMALKLVVNKHQGIPILKLIGRVIGVDDKKFSRKLEALFKRNVSRIILDVSETDFIDSHGVGIIVYYHTLMQKSDRELMILNSNPNPVAYMTRLFEMTNLNRVLNVRSSLTEREE